MLGGEENIMYNIDESKLIREYGWATERKHYTVETEVKQYRQGRESERDVFSYSNCARMTVADMRKIFVS